MDEVESIRKMQDVTIMIAATGMGVYSEFPAIENEIRFRKSVSRDHLFNSVGLTF